MASFRERFQSLTNPDKLLSLSFWRDEEAVACWRSGVDHRAAQSAGRRGVFRDYRLRVAACNVLTVAYLAWGFNRAASDLNTGCLADMPRTPSARFQVIRSRLYITWLAVQTIQVAVAQFPKELSDQQRARFNTLQLAAKP